MLQPAMTCINQITEGQVTFMPFDILHDRVFIGSENRMYEIYAGSQWETQLKRQFPQEHKALNEFFRLINGGFIWHYGLFWIKLIPLWLSKFLFATGIMKAITRCFETKGRTLKDVIESLTDNKDLREVLAYREVFIILKIHLSQNSQCTE